MSASLAQFLALLRRQPYPAFCVAVTLGLAATAWYIRGENQTLAIEHDERTREGEAMLALLVGGSTQRAELAAAHEATRRIEENLLIEANLAENLWYFYKLEEQTKVRLPELHQLGSPAGDRTKLYQRIPYTLRVDGTFREVSAFLRGLETGPRLVAITGFSLTRRMAGTDDLSLDLDVELLGKK